MNANLNLDIMETVILLLSILIVICYTGFGLSALLYTKRKGLLLDVKMPIFLQFFVFFLWWLAIPIWISSNKNI